MWLIDCIKGVLRSMWNLLRPPLIEGHQKSIHRNETHIGTPGVIWHGGERAEQGESEGKRKMNF